MSQMLLLRPMLDSDLPAVLANERMGYSCPWSEQNLKSSLAGNDRAWVGIQNELVVAHGVTSLILDEGHVLNLCVGHRWQGTGIGGCMLQHMLEDLSVHGALRVFLEVRQSNRPALALYARMGFVQIGTRRGYYPGDPVREDALVMSRTLVSDRRRNSDD